ncbi:MAG: hypothetical protein IT385_06280 [Deltaproteobacteria bacterium]|nr:hypothetical protein [Deltaproteobacteria bacterium]
MRPPPERARDPSAPHDDDAVEGGEPGAEGTAWQLLSSPRVLLGLLVVLGLLLAWAQTVPQRVTPAELAPLGPFAEMEALAGLGLDDAFVSWSTLLVGLLAALVALGLLLGHLRRGSTPTAASRAGGLRVTRADVVPAPLEAVRERLPGALARQRLAVRVAPDSVVARAGWAIEATMVLVVGLLALVAAAFIGRGNGLDARLTLVPGEVGEAAELRVKDGDLLLPRALPLDLRCPRPDPMDPTRTQACTLTTGTPTALGAAPSEAVVLRPGETTRTEHGLSLTPREASRRIPPPDEPLEVLVRRAPDAPPERLTLTPGQPIELTSSGHRLQAFVGQDGPLVLVTGPNEAPRLLGPPMSATPAPPASGPWLEVVPPIRQVIAARTTPESTLTILGLVFVALGLVGLALVPSTLVTLTRVAGGTRVEVAGSHPDRVARAAASLASGAP